MVKRLVQVRYFSNDPNNPKGGRGPGNYYHRGSGVWSKFTGKHLKKTKKDVAKFFDDKVKKTVDQLSMGEFILEYHGARKFMTIRLR